MESQLGSIEPGKIANLVLLKKSPLESVDAYDSITTVWCMGSGPSRRFGRQFNKIVRYSGSGSPTYLMMRVSGRIAHPEVTT